MMRRSPLLLALLALGCSAKSDKGPASSGGGTVGGTYTGPIGPATGQISAGSGEGKIAVTISAQGLLDIEGISRTERVHVGSASLPAAAPWTFQVTYAPAGGTMEIDGEVRLQAGAQHKYDILGTVKVTTATTTTGSAGATTTAGGAPSGGTAVPTTTGGGAAGGPGTTGPGTSVGTTTSGAPGPSTAGTVGPSTTGTAGPSGPGGTTTSTTGGRVTASTTGGGVAGPTSDAGAPMSATGGGARVSNTGGGAPVTNTGGAPVTNTGGGIVVPPGGTTGAISTTTPEAGLPTSGGAAGPASAGPSTGSMAGGMTPDAGPATTPPPLPLGLPTGRIHPTADPTATGAITASAIDWAVASETRLGNVTGMPGAFFFLDDQTGFSSLDPMDVNSMIPPSVDACATCSGDATLLRTIDGGASWESLGLIRGQPKASKSYIWAQREIMQAVNTSASTAEIVRSADAGRSWQSSSTFAPVLTTSFGIPAGGSTTTPKPTKAFFDAQHAIALEMVPDPTSTFTTTASKNLVVITSDGGTTWKTVELPAQPSAPAGATATSPFYADALRILVFGTVNSGTVGATTGPAQPGVAWISEDGGTTWEALGSIAGLSVPGDVRFVDADRGWLAHVENLASTLATTRDGGRTWSKLALPPPPPEYTGYSYAFQRIFPVDAASAWALDDAGHLLFTDGTTWTLHKSACPARSVGIGGSPISGHFFSASRGFLLCYVDAATPGGDPPTVLYATSDGAQTWTPIAGVQTHATAMRFFDAASGIILGREGAQLTTDGGVTFATPRGRVASPERSIGYPVSPTDWWATVRDFTTTGETIVHTSDSGTRWQLARTMTPSWDTLLVQGTTLRLPPGPIDESSRSSDEGATWWLDASRGPISVGIVDEKTAYGTIEEPGDTFPRPLWLAKSDDGGATWVNLLPLPDASYDMCFDAPNDGWLIDGSGCIFRFDGTRVVYTAGGPTVGGATGGTPTSPGRTSPDGGAPATGSTGGTTGGTTTGPQCGGYGSYGSLACSANAFWRGDSILHADGSTTPLRAQWIYAPDSQGNLALYGGSLVQYSTQVFALDGAHVWARTPSGHVARYLDDAAFGAFTGGAVIGAPTVYTGNRSPTLGQIGSVEMRSYDVNANYLGSTYRFTTTVSDLDGDPVTVRWQVTLTSGSGTLASTVGTTNMLVTDSIGHGAVTVTADDGKGGTDSRNVSF